MTNQLERIISQIDTAKPDLDAYKPTDLGWYERTTATAKLVVPWLCTTGNDICGYVQEVCNSSTELRTVWKALHESHQLGPVGEKIDRLLGQELLLVSEIAGDVMSRVLTDYIIGTFPRNELATNSKSDYPDLFVKTRDYSGLPTFSVPKKDRPRDRKWSMAQP